MNGKHTKQNCQWVFHASIFRREKLCSVLLLFLIFPVNLPWPLLGPIQFAIHLCDTLNRFHIVHATANKKINLLDFLLHNFYKETPACVPLNVSKSVNKWSEIWKRVVWKISSESNLYVCACVLRVWWNHITIKIGRFHFVRWLILLVNACNSNEFNWKLVPHTLYIYMVQWTRSVYWKSNGPLNRRFNDTIEWCVCSGKLIKAWYFDSSHFNPDNRRHKKSRTAELSDEPFYEL